MLRRVLPRFPLFRVSAPILPISSRLSARTVPVISLTGSPRLSSSRLFHHVPARLTSTPPPQNDPGSQLPPDATLSQRLKHLIKSYGWYALGVYFVLSTLDFTVAFAGINLLGAEQVASAAAYIKTAVGFMYTKPPEPGRDEMNGISAGDASREGLYATLVLAYTIHKTLFLPVRVGLTAVLTPRLVGWLRTRGWAGGEGARKAARDMRDRIQRKD
ncbi:hypothetical protein DEU56DRAFT_908451 [Suillus clintonianus]|uniref:uncharacterized protein n=1 Tax=Suillus clintonianus TaxID=1904413 RepID=UPI001B879E1C|nr:uncharacterized protein DEU56DRAFT_908451 [Suillus clintonianus]KAG2150809.1 hypothetical protein DEU56DRAFT_908451 [Suillus clintonianus]